LGGIPWIIEKPKKRKRYHNPVAEPLEQKVPAVRKKLGRDPAN